MPDIEKFLPVAIFKMATTIPQMATGRNFSMSGINICPHIKFWWYQTMLNFCSIVVAILKMATGRNFSMLGINLGHHYLATYYDVPNWFLTSKNFYRSPFSKWSPQYCTNSTLSDFNDIWYVGRLWCRELIPDIEKFLPDFDDIGQCRIFAVLWRPFWKWRPVEIFQCRESIRDIIIYPHIKFWWYQTMLNFCSPTLKNFYRSPFSKWPPQHRKYSTLSDIIKIWYVGR
jgi:hypothetical protein